MVGIKTDRPRAKAQPGEQIHAQVFLRMDSRMAREFTHGLLVVNTVGNGTWVFGRGKKPLAGQTL
jgi:hypothetical protein